MYYTSGELMQYHEERVGLLTRQYQDSLWQSATFKHQFGSLTDRIRSWFDRDVDTTSGVGSRLDTNVIQVEGS